MPKAVNELFAAHVTNKKEKSDCIFESMSSILSRKDIEFKANNMIGIHYSTL